MEKLLVIAGAALFFNAILAFALVGLGVRFGYLRWGNGSAEQVAQPSSSEAATLSPPSGMNAPVDLLDNGRLRLFASRASSVELMMKVSLISNSARFARLVDDALVDEQIIDFGMSVASFPRTTSSMPSQAIAFCR